MASPSSLCSWNYLTSGNRLGIDGNWSTSNFFLGSNSQQVNVLVSTSLSEFWAVGPGGCLPKEPHCNAARGGVYTPEASKRWSSLGIWQLGLDFLGYGGNGEYGLDILRTSDATTDTSLTMSGVLIAALNTTNYFDGLFGLGITQGNFENRVADSPLTQAVKEFGWIPSYSYGYTAGAHYRNSPVSLTLGGYDATRFVAHSNEFTLGQSDGLARPLVRGIEVTTGGQDRPETWDSGTQILSSWNNSFNALIDSTTPFLWLPDDVCDNFAEALNLTYNSTFELYTTNNQYNDFPEFSFTFSLSSFDNTDDFGGALDVPGTVNITIPSEALVNLLEYPFMNEAIAYGAPAVPYFALRKTYNSSTFIIGRSFLQESYLITKYDEGLFSIHQALFPNTPASGADLTAIKQPDNGPYPGPPAGNSELSKGAMAGIAVGVIAAFTIVVIGIFCYRRRRKNKNKDSGATMEESKDSSSLVAHDTPKTQVARILSKLLRRKKSPKSGQGAGKESQQPSEAPDSAIYELPAPVPPVELDGDDGTSLNGDTELGTGSTQNMSAYETARRKMERQLQGPVPAYSPPENGVMPPSEKTEDAANPDLPHPQAQPPSLPSSPRSPGDGSTNSNSLPPSLPSPITPRFDWRGRIADLPSPMTATMPASSTRDSGSNSAPLSSLRLSSNEQSHDSAAMNQADPDNALSTLSSNPSLPAPPQTIQRTPIDPSKVVFLGPLPENVRLSRRNSLPQAVDEGIPGGHNTYDSLGSNFTVDEEQRIEALTRQLDLSTTQFSEPRNRGQTSHRGQAHLPAHIQTQGSGLLRGHSTSTNEPDTPRSQERIDPGSELIHVPQLAERRYSWEEER
ncbi:Fc.00g087410.m01.CDS01 [Cosmosporella sp. VM-42]